MSSEDGQWKKGKSGNPAGRPAALVSGRRVRAALFRDSLQILGVVVNAAKAGDMAAAKILMDRICPPLKAVDQSVMMPYYASLSAQGDEVIRSIVDGRITPEAGASLISALTGQGRLIEMDSLIQRIDALERVHALPDPSNASVVEIT